MRDQLDEAAQALRMHLHVIAVRAALEGAAGPRPGFREQGFDVFLQLCYPFPAQAALAGDDAVAVQPAHDGAGVDHAVVRIAHDSSSWAAIVTPSRQVARTAEG
jgi:hypothetical protein